MDHDEPGRAADTAAAQKPAGAAPHGPEDAAPPAYEPAVTAGEATARTRRSRHAGDPFAHAAAWARGRREKIVAEIESNRRGEYVVPTWVLALILVLFVAGWAALVIFS
jgi:hypothetical protein